MKEKLEIDKCIKKINFYADISKESNKSYALSSSLKYHQIQEMKRFVFLYEKLSKESQSKNLEIYLEIKQILNSQKVKTFFKFQYILNIITFLSFFITILSINNNEITKLKTTIFYLVITSYLPLFYTSFYVVKYFLYDVCLKNKVGISFYKIDIDNNLIMRIYKARFNDHYFKKFKIILFLFSLSLTSILIFLLWIKPNITNDNIYFLALIFSFFIFISLIGISFLNYKFIQEEITGKKENYKSIYAIIKILNKNHRKNVHGNSDWFKADFSWIKWFDSFLPPYNIKENKLFSKIMESLRYEFTQENLNNIFQNEDLKNELKIYFKSK